MNENFLGNLRLISNAVLWFSNFFGINTPEFTEALTGTVIGSVHAYYEEKGVKFDSKGSITFTPKKDYQMTLILGTAKAGRNVKINGTQTTVGGTENQEGAYYEMEKIRINKDTEYILTKGSEEGLVMLIKLEPVAE